MSLTDIERVRLRIADKSSIVREIDEGDGVAKFYKLNHENVATSPAIQVWIDDILQSTPADYSVDTLNGIVTFALVPTINANLVFQYYWTLFTDDEIQDYLDQNGGSVNIASAKLLYSLAANAALLAKRSTLTGGSGLGSITEDTSVAARELRNTAEGLIQLEGQIGSDIPAEGLTEVPWTEHMYQRQLEQDIIRDN
jgi:hypothetical protein